MFSVVLQAGIGGKCFTYWPYRKEHQKGGEHHEAVDLRIPSEWNRIDNFPEVRSSPFLRDVLLTLNREDSPVFTTGCVRRPWKCKDPSCTIEHVDVVVAISSRDAAVYSSWDRTLEALAFPLSRYLLGKFPSESRVKFVVTVAPYVIDAEGPDYRWQIEVHATGEVPKFIQSVAEFLARPVQ